MQITNMNIIDTHSPMPSHRPFNSKQQQQQQQQQQRDESSLVLKIKRHTTKNEHEIVRNNEDETTKTCLSRTDNNPVTNKIVKIENDDSTTSTTTALSSDDRENRTTSPSPNTTNNTDNIAVTALSPITGTVSEKKSNRLKKVNNPSKTTKTTTILRQKRLRRNGATATKRSISPVFDIKSQKQQTKTKLQRLSIDSNNNCTTTTENCSKIEQQTKETKGTLSMNSTNSNTSTNHNNQQEDVENDERQTQLPHSKRFKYDKLQKVDASVETASIGVVTEPDNLGPCSPGTTVVLEGIVWNETDSGVLVVNVTWRGKTYVGTLLDSTKLNWAAPRLTCESPTGDFDTRSKNGRNKRGNRCSAPQLFPSISNPLPSNSSTIATGLSLSTTNIEQPTGDRKLRNIKSRQTKRNTITSSTTTTLNDRRQSLNNETTGASADLNPTNDNSILSSLNSPFRTNATTTNFFFEKRCFPPINISSDNQLRPINDSIQTNTTESFLSCHIDNMFRCPETDCYKRYPSVIALRYHLGNAHDKSDWDLNNDNLPQKLECMEKKKDNTIEEISNSIVLNEKVTIKNIVECDDKIIDIKTEIPIIQEYPLTSLLNNVNQKDNELIDQKHSTHEEDVAHILANVADYVRPSTTTTPVPSSITLNQSEHSRSPPLVSIMPSVCSINRISPPLLSSISPNTSLPQTTLSWPSPQSKIILSSPMTSVLSESPCIQNSTSNSLSSPPLPTKLVSTISNNNNNNNRYNEHTTSLKTDNNRLINSQKSPLFLNELQTQQITTAATIYPPKVTLEDINQTSNSKQENYHKVSLISPPMPKPIFPTTSYLSLSENSHNKLSECEKSIKTNTLKYADHVLLPIKDEEYNPLTVTTLQQPRPSPSPATLSPLHNKLLNNGSAALVSPSQQQYLSPRSLNNVNAPYLFTETKPSSSSIYQNIINNNSLWTTSTNVKERKKKRKLRDEQHSTISINNNHAKMNPTLFGPTSPLMTTTSSNSSSCSSVSSSIHPTSNPLNLSSTQTVSQQQSKQQLQYPTPSSPAYSDISDENDNENTDDMKRNNNNMLNNSVTTNLLAQTMSSKTTPPLIKSVDEENIINETPKHPSLVIQPPFYTSSSHQQQQNGAIMKSTSLAGESNKDTQYRWNEQTGNVDPNKGMEAFAAAAFINNMLAMQWYPQMTTAAVLQQQAVLQQSEKNNKSINDNNSNGHLAHTSKHQQLLSISDTMDSVGKKTRPNTPNRSNSNNNKANRPISHTNVDSSNNLKTSATHNILDGRRTHIPPTTNISSSSITSSISTNSSKRPDSRLSNQHDLPNPVNIGSTSFQSPNYNNTSVKHLSSPSFPSTMLAEFQSAMIEDFLNSYGREQTSLKDSPNENILNPTTKLTTTSMTRISPSSSKTTNLGVSTTAAILDYSRSSQGQPPPSQHGFHNGQNFV